MKLAPLLLLTLIGCRPLDPGASETLADMGPGNTVGALQIGELRVIDGDTFEMNGETIRISNIDAPESGSRAECMAEAHLAVVATQALNDLLGTEYVANGRAILPTLRREGRDRYGRTLARVTLAQGGDAGDLMVERDLAARWTGQRADWCGATT